MKVRNMSVNTAYYARAYAIAEKKTYYSNELSFTTRHHLGEPYGGGKVFHIDASTVYGLIAAVADQDIDVPWAPGNLFITETGATSATNGAGNTDRIISTYGNSKGRYAAKVCRDYAGSGFRDWYLPSKDELVLLLEQKGVIGGFETQNFHESDYWSSTEYSYSDAWESNFSAGLKLHSWKGQKDTRFRARAIRAF